VPTIEEAAGLKGFDASSWFGLFAPAGTPRAIVDKVRADVSKALSVPEVRERFLARRSFGQHTRTVRRVHPRGNGQVDSRRQFLERQGRLTDRNGRRVRPCAKPARSTDSESHRPW
jgi:Tripartite tricarboxylate transporter family receptor